MIPPNAKAIGSVSGNSEIQTAWTSTYQPVFSSITDQTLSEVAKTFHLESLETEMLTEGTGDL